MKKNKILPILLMIGIIIPLIFWLFNQGMTKFQIVQRKWFLFPGDIFLMDLIIFLVISLREDELPEK